VLPCGVDIKYPAVNKTLLGDIEKDGLLLSQFDEGFRATSWSFVVRNELVVALSDILIVTEADVASGSMRSVEFAQKMKKEIFVLPHRLGESRATQKLLEENKATAIYDIDTFLSMLKERYGLLDIKEEADENLDPFITFCKTIPTYDEAMQKFGSRVFEAELGGIINIKDGRVYLI
ncbi:MAG: DNA-processing protein DprA, partial [Sulfurimonadaceae bacterium]|nr:DNA-processing protein DprA [Sulfurimonadaceae bacterium]